MDDQELDDWFEQEREKLENAFFAAAVARKDPEKARARFDNGYKALLAEFQKRQADLYASQRRHAAIQRPITRWKELWRTCIDESGAWMAMRREQLRKWWFDRRIRRMLKHWR